MHSTRIIDVLYYIFEPDRQHRKQVKPSNTKAADPLLKHVLILAIAPLARGTATQVLVTILVPVPGMDLEVRLEYVRVFLTVQQSDTYTSTKEEFQMIPHRITNAY